MALNFCAWNIFGIKDAKKLIKVRNYMEQKRMNFINLTETRVKSLGLEFYKIFPQEKYLVLHDERGEGMLTIFNKEAGLNYTYTNHSARSSLAQAFEFKDGDDQVLCSVLFVYIPPRENGIPPALLRKFENFDVVIGDMNVYTDSLHNGKFRNQRERDIYNFLASNDDFTVNQGISTWKNDLQREAGPDLVIRKNGSAYFEERKGTSLLSDHYSLDLFENFRVLQQEKHTAPVKVKKFNFKRISQEIVEEKWSELPEKLKFDKMYKFSQNLVTAAFDGTVTVHPSEAAGLQTVSSRLVNFKNIDQVEDYFLELAQGANANLLGQGFKLLNFMRENEEALETTVNIDTFSPNTRHSEAEAFGKFAKITGTAEILSVSQKKKLKRIQNFWQNFIRARQFNFFRMSELNLAISKLNKSSRGPDHIDANFLPRSSENKKKLLFALNSGLFSTKRFNPTLLKATLKFIPKPNGALRPLCIGSRILGLLSTMVGERLNNYVSSSEDFRDSFGFVKGRSVDLLKLHMNNEVNKAREAGEKVNIVQLDLKSAYLFVKPIKLICKVYDLVRKSGNFRELAVVCGYALRWCAGLNRKVVSWFDSKTGGTRKVVMKTGMSMGDSISAIYFCIYFDYRTGIQGVRVLLFADDNHMLVIGKSWEIVDKNTQNLVTDFERWTEENGMEISTEKSNVMSLFRKKKIEKIAGIKTVKSCCSLGVMIDSNWSYSGHVEYLEQYVKRRAGLIRALRLRLGFSYKALTSIVLCLRNRLTFGTFFLLELSFSLFRRLESAWARLVRAAFGALRLIPFRELFNFCGLAAWNDYAIYWFAKWQFKLRSLNLTSKVDRCHKWSVDTGSGGEGQVRYNFRSFTLMKLFLSKKKEADKYEDWLKDFTGKVWEKFEFLEGLQARSGSKIDEKFELKKRMKLTRVHKILDNETIQTRIKEMNEKWYEKRKM